MTGRRPSQLTAINKRKGCDYISIIKRRIPAITGRHTAVEEPYPKQNVLHGLRIIEELLKKYSGANMYPRDYIFHYKRAKKL